MTPRTETDLRDWVLADCVTYGPVQSRRMGTSLGVNLLPPNVKVCSFDCLYCQCGWSDRDFDRSMRHAYPSLETIRKDLKESLVALQAKNVTLDAITIAGNGEPILHPDFLEAVKVILGLRDRYAPRAKASVLSNGSELWNPDVVQGLNLLDERNMKLDAGDADLFQKIDRPLVGFDIATYVAQLRMLKDVVIQTCFFTGGPDNSNPEAVAAWQRCLIKIQPKQAQIYTIDRMTAGKSLGKVSRDRLEDIAGRTRKETGLDVVVY